LPGSLRLPTTPGLKPGVVVFGCWILLAAGWVTAGCDAVAPLQKARVDHVVDGDTVVLADGRRVRLIGVNAPETGRADKPAEPLGNRARKTLIALLPKGSPVFLQIGQQPRDHYGRTLAHAFRPKATTSVEAGASVEAELLRQGLAQFIAIPPNLALADCLHDAEREAMTARRGIWADSYFKPQVASALSASEAGYRRVTLTVTSAQADKHGWWLNTDGPLVLRVLHRDVSRFAAPPKQWVGRTLTVRGWIKNRSANARVQSRGHAPLLLPIEHPYMVERGL